MNRGQCDKCRCQLTVVKVAKADIPTDERKGERRRVYAFLCVTCFAARPKQKPIRYKKPVGA